MTEEEKQKQKDLITKFRAILDAEEDWEIRASKMDKLLESADPSLLATVGTMLITAYEFGYTRWSNDFNTTIFGPNVN